MDRAPLPVHESLETAFIAVVPPRPVPLVRRLSWRALLLLLGFAPTRVVLLGVLKALRR